MSATLTTCRFDNDDDDEGSADIFGCKKRCAQKWKHSDQSLNSRSRERNAAISKGRGGRVVPMPAHLDEVIFKNIDDLISKTKYISIINTKYIK